MRMGQLLNQLVWLQMVARLVHVAHGLSIRGNKRAEDNIPVYIFSWEQGSAVSFEAWREGALVPEIRFFTL